MIKKLHFIFRREKQKGTNFFFNFTSDKYSLKVKKKKMIHTSFSSLGETKQEQWGPFYFPFLLLLEVPLVSKSYISCFQFFSLSIFSFNTFAVKGSSIFFEDQPSNHCKCCWPLSFSLLEIDAWLIIPFMITVYH